MRNMSSLTARSFHSQDICYQYSILQESSKSIWQYVPKPDSLMYLTCEPPLRVIDPFTIDISRPALPTQILQGVSLFPVFLKYVLRLEHKSIASGSNDFTYLSNVQSRSSPLNVILSPSDDISACSHLSLYTHI